MANAQPNAQQKNQAAQRETAPKVDGVDAVVERAVDEAVAAEKKTQADAKSESDAAEKKAKADAAAETPADPAPFVPRFARDRVLGEEGPAIAGQPAHVIAGALHDSDADDYSAQEIADLVERFNAREVEIDAADKVPTDDQEG